MCTETQLQLLKLANLSWVVASILVILDEGQSFAFPSVADTQKNVIRIFRLAVEVRMVRNRFRKSSTLIVSWSRIRSWIINFEMSQSGEPIQIKWNNFKRTPQSKALWYVVRKAKGLGTYTIMVLNLQGIQIKKLRAWRLQYWSSWDRGLVIVEKNRKDRTYTSQHRTHERWRWRFQYLQDAMMQDLGICTKFEWPTKNQREIKELSTEGKVSNVRRIVDMIVSLISR